MPVSIHRLQAAQQQGSTTGQVLAETVQDLHPASQLSQVQQAQFQTCCSRLVTAATQASCPALLLAAEVCFNHAYQLSSRVARGCPRHPVQA